MNDPYTDWQRRQHAADGGYAASLAVGHEKAAAVLRNLPPDLTAVATEQYAYAVTGTDEDRRAAVDAWAKAHHVPAAWHPLLGYAARLQCGPLAVVVIAAPVSADVPAPREDSPQLEAVAA